MNDFIILTKVFFLVSSGFQKQTALSTKCNYKIRTSHKSFFCVLFVWGKEWRRKPRYLSKWKIWVRGVADKSIVIFIYDDDDAKRIKRLTTILYTYKKASSWYSIICNEYFGCFEFIVRCMMASVHEILKFLLVILRALNVLSHSPFYILNFY